MPPFRAFRIHEEQGKVRAGFESLTVEDLPAGEVLVRVTCSSINYKDALAATGAGKILKRTPLTGGIDLAGVVESSSDARYASGDRVLVTGCGLSETHDGGYAEYARVPGDWVIPLPPGLDEMGAMGLGTAGFTAALAIHKMQHMGLTAGTAPVAVTGASGGVGTIAIDLLAGSGHEVVAITGKAQAASYLKELGAARVLARSEIPSGGRPLETAQFAGAIDNVGGEMLAWLTRTVGFWGSIASVGLAGSAELKTTVMPFILRGVNILGINSSATSRELRLAVWQRIASDLKPAHLGRIVTRVIRFEELPQAFEAYLSGSVTGRTVVKIS